jgi:hypothetical protein
LIIFSLHLNLKFAEANLFIIVKSRSRHAYSKKLHAQLFPRAKVGAIKVFWNRLRQKNAGLLKLRRQHLGVCSNFRTNTHTYPVGGAINLCAARRRVLELSSLLPILDRVPGKGKFEPLLVATLIFQLRLCFMSASSYFIYWRLSQ